MEPGAPMARAVARPYVLLVDNEPAVARSAELVLRDAAAGAGWDVRAVTSPEAARDLICEHPPALLIADHDLRASVTGLDLCRLALARDPETPCILMSASPQLLESRPRTARRVLFLAKPATREALLGALRRAIQRRASFLAEE